jgi:septal ring factor EnvC (AmiA/AmiB activator)
LKILIESINNSIWNLKGTEDLPAVNQGVERSTAEQQQRYQKYLSEIETLQDRIKHDQIDYEKKRNEYEHQIQTRKEHVDQLKTDYVRLVKQIASKAVFSRSGKSISNQVFHITQNWRTYIPLVFITVVDRRDKIPAVVTHG